MSKHIKNIQEFANKHGLFFEQQEGECGFGRKCVGLSYRGNYVEYNPTKEPEYEYIKELHDERLFEITPPDAYHKHTCLAVLGRGPKAIKQLSEWVDKLKELNVTVETYETGATGIQAMFSGITGKAFKVHVKEKATS